MKIEEAIRPEDYTKNPYNYYDDVFCVLKQVDNIIQKLFTEDEVYYTYKIFNNKDIGKVILSLVLDRLVYEHFLTNSSDFKYELKEDGFKISLSHIYKPVYSEECRTGRTTRGIDTYIQTLFHCRGEWIGVTDHYTYELMMSDRYRGRACIPNAMGDKCMFKKLMDRLKWELPRNVFQYVETNTNKNMIRLNLEVSRNKYMNFE